MKSITFTEGLDIPVTLKSNKEGFTIVYGQQVTGPLNYYQAYVELGACLIHSAECAGNIVEPRQSARAAIAKAEGRDA